jgi:hypothetical protein
VFKRNIVSVGNIYAITAGSFMGEFWVLMDKNHEYVFLSLPDFKIRNVTQDKFDIGVKESILEFQEKLPKDIFNDCLEKYNTLKS